MNLPLKFRFVESDDTENPKADIAASGIQHRWAMRRERKTPNYTTDWNELPVVGY
ncbi:MAG: DUF4113 domain-containing protein [Gallionella sp.]|nr:DUF4113 domain-containing protein [Gallionella sp.]